MLTKINQTGFHLSVKFTLTCDQFVVRHWPSLDRLFLFEAVLLFVGSTAIRTVIVSDGV